eukprot:m.166220 g.166220  ORF g.166220 m.166220 type:complete len:118 (-) comp9898_c0_seq6:6340-6693(-)
MRFCPQRLLGHFICCAPIYSSFLIPKVKRSRERKKMADGGPASGSTAADSVQPASIDSGGFDHASELQALRVTVARLMREKALLARRLQDPGSLTPDDLREIAAILAAGAVAPPLQL